MDRNTNSNHNYNGSQAPVVSPESTFHHVDTLESLDTIDFDDVLLDDSPALFPAA
jgi:hypothetical protein